METKLLPNGGNLDTLQCHHLARIRPLLPLRRQSRALSTRKRHILPSERTTRARARFDTEFSFLLLVPQHIFDLYIVYMLYVPVRIRVSLQCHRLPGVCGCSVWGVIWPVMSKGNTKGQIDQLPARVRLPHVPYLVFFHAPFTVPYPFASQAHRGQR